jgi:hypothetical protein
MTNYKRGLRWQAASTIVAAILVIGTFAVSGGRGYIIEVDFSEVPEQAIGADFFVDGEAVDTLKMLRGMPINGIRVSEGEHEVVIQSEYCLGRPRIVIPEGTERAVTVSVQVRKRTERERAWCVFELRQ